MPHYYFDMVVTEKTHDRRVMIFSGSLRPCSEFPPHHFYHNEFLHSSQLQEYHTAFCLLSIFHSILLSNTTRGYVFNRASTSPQEDTSYLFAPNILMIATSSNSAKAKLLGTLSNLFKITRRITVCRFFADTVVTKNRIQKCPNYKSTTLKLSSCKPCQTKKAQKRLEKKL